MFQGSEPWSVKKEFEQCKALGFYPNLAPEALSLAGVFRCANFSQPFRDIKIIKISLVSLSFDRWSDRLNCAGVSLASIGNVPYTQSIADVSHAADYILNYLDSNSKASAYSSLLCAMTLIPSSIVEVVTVDIDGISRAS
jgi:hypothetical protein